MNFINIWLNKRSKTQRVCLQKFKKPTKLNNIVLKTREWFLGSQESNQVWEKEEGCDGGEAPGLWMLVDCISWFGFGYMGVFIIIFQQYIYVLCDFFYACYISQFKSQVHWTKNQVWALVLAWSDTYTLSVSVFYLLCLPHHFAMRITLKDLEMLYTL